jgi:hypothetical protein
VLIASFNAGSRKHILVANILTEARTKKMHKDTDPLCHGMAVWLNTQSRTAEVPDKKVVGVSFFVRRFSYKMIAN